MKKDKLLLVTSLISLFSISLAVITATKIDNKSTFAQGVETWHHYAAVAPTETTHGSKEFWAKGSEGCSTPYFANPGVTCIEHDFSLYNSFETLAFGDARFVPSIRDSENGVYPTLINDSTISYGLYPQERVKDNSLISVLNSLTSSSIASNGWYLYNNRYYAKVVGNKTDINYKFNDGSSIVNGTTYWFKCQPINWKIYNNQGNGTYSVLSENLLEMHCFYITNKSRNNDSIKPNNYQYSDLRSWLNGYDGSSYNVSNYSGSGFINKAFFNSSFIQETLVDNSISQTSSDTESFVCSNTNDKIYCLSYNEYKTLFTSQENKKTAGDYSIAQGAVLEKNTSDNKFYGIYWTRSPYPYPGNAWAVDSYGLVTHYLLQYYVSANFSVRPAMTIHF